MKIVILDRLTLGHDIDLSPIEALGETEFFDTTAPEQTLDRCINADIIITNKVVLNKLVLENLPQLKLICVAATGTNNIDLSFAKEKGIEVLNAKGYSTKSVVQHTFSMLFYLLNSSRYYDEYVKSESWIESPIFTNLGQPFKELSGKKWGIIGLGEIGKNVAKIADAFDCEVIYYSTSGNNKNPNYKSVPLNELLSTCDIISIHAPLNNQTKDLLNHQNLTLIKKGSILLNLGRGGIVNEDDIVKYIEDESLFFGTDVTEVEPMQKTSSFRKVLNSKYLYITPHIAWSSIEARKSLVRIIEQNIIHFENQS